MPASETAPSAAGQVRKEMIAEYEAWKRRTADPFPGQPKRAKKTYTKS